MKIETKFHIGDWIVNNGHSYLIAGIDYLDNRYLFEIGGYTHEQLNWEYIENVDGKYHLWSIEDAKDGDVLVDICDDFVNPLIFILKKFEHKDFGLSKLSDYSSYCCLTMSISQKFKEGYYHHMHNIHPATKEQRDLLFKKMHEAGYMWDANKRELKKIENKTSDNVEPKFEDGDWVVKGDVVAQIFDVQEQYYVGIDTNGNDFTSSRFLSKDKIHLWSIEDAKDGDVLVDEENNIGIYKEIEGICWHSYFYLGCNNHLYGFSIGGSHVQNNTKPATKEQHYLLFKKMEEAGFKWDDNKKELKELKKIENKTADNIEPKFHVNEWVVTGLNDVVQIKAVNNGHYSTDNGIEYTIPYVDKYWHKWRIQDAKDGDVLVLNDEVFIYAHRKQLYDIAVAHCFVNSGGGFYFDGEFGYTERGKSVRPATKEQRDLLFKKMHEAGYMWDANKRELKKTENSDYHTPKFEVGDVMRTLQEAAEGMTDGMPVIISIDKEYYHCNNELIAIKNQDDYEYPPMNKRQKTDDKVIVTLIEYVKNEIIDDTHNPYTAHGHEVLMELLAAYNHYQETEHDGVNYIFNIENNDDVICCMKGGMTSKEVCDLYSASQSTHTKYFYYGYNDNGASQISTMDVLRTNINAWLDEIVTCVIAFPDEDESYRAIYTRYITNELT